MGRKNTMKLWQMLALAILLFAVVMSMFLPIVGVKGERILDIVLDSAEEMMDQEFDIPEYGKVRGFNLGDLDKDNQEKIEKVVKEFDEYIEKLEEKSGIRWSALSGIQFITMDTNAYLLLDKDYTKEDVEKLDSDESRSKLRSSVILDKVLFAIVYFGAAVLLVFILLAYFLKWSKYTVAILSSVFGFCIAVFYALIRWAAPWAISVSYGVDSKSAGLIWGAIVGMGVMTCFILGILICIMGILTCIIGRASVSSQSVSGSGFDSGWGSSGQGGFGLDGFGSGSFGTGGFGQGGGGQFQPGPIFPPVDNTVKRDPDPVIKPEPPKPPKPKCGRVKCTQGAAMGQGFKLPEDRKVIVGKSPQNATLVIHDQHVSNVHCSIRYRQETDSYIVKDHSTNGTFVQGVRLAKDVAMEYPAGTVLSLADGTNKITLG